jgi:hypothetical protein
LSKKIHCDICDVQLGHPPYQTIWNTVETPNIQLDICNKCITKLENGINAIVYHFKEESLAKESLAKEKKFEAWESY